MIELFAPLLGLGLVFWILLGGPSRAREQRNDRRRRGGRTAKDRSFWGAPARDRPFEPGALLLVFVVVTLAETVLDASAAGTSALSTALILGTVIAIGFRYRPDIVSTGMGLVGIVVLVLERLGARGCGGAATAGQNALWLLGAAALLAGVVLFRGLVSPVRAVTRSVTSVSRSFWTSPGEARPLGVVGQTALVTFGALDLLDLVLQPSGMERLDGIWTSSGVLVGAIVMAAAVIALGMALIPQFTTSVVGLGVAFGNVILLAESPACRDVTLMIMVGGCFYAVSLLARRFS